MKMPIMFRDQVHLGHCRIGCRRTGRLDNIPQLERRGEVLLLHKPGIDQLPLLPRIFKLDLKMTVWSVLSEPQI